MTNAVILSEEEFQALMDKIDKLTKTVEQHLEYPYNKIFTNTQFCAFLRISSRTAQTWRDDGIIKYSQIGNKLYYTMKDIREMLDKYKIK